MLYLMPDVNNYYYTKHSMMGWMKRKENYMDQFYLVPFNPMPYISSIHQRIIMGFIGKSLVISHANLNSYFNSDETIMWHLYGGDDSSISLNAFGRGVISK